MFTLLALILSLWLTSCRFGYLGRDQAVTLNIATSLSLTGPTTVEASACSGPFSVTGVSSSGTTPATFDPSARFSIAGAGESEIFTDSSCSSGALGSEIPLLSGTNEADFYLKITRSSDITVTANSEGLTSASLPLTVLPGVPTKLAIYAPSTIGQYQCVRVTSQLLDAGGAVTAARNDLNVRLFALGGNGTLLYPDGTCTTPISNIPLLTGASGFSVYTLGPIPGSISLTFDPRTADITEGTETITVMAGSTPRLALTPPGGNVVAGNCIPLSARALTSDGSQLTVRSDIAVAITATGTTGQLYSNNACTTALPNNTATIPAFTTMGILYFRATVVTPTFTLTGSSSGFISATYSSAVIAAAPDKLLMLNAPSSARALACAGPVPLKLKDTFNNDALAVAKTTINLTATGTSGAVTKFYGPNDSTCAASVTAVNVNMSANTTQFYFSVQKADSSTLNANSTGLTGATTTVSILTAQGNPNILALTTNRPSPLAGECVAVTLTSQDSFGNPKEVNPTALTFNLSTNTVGSGFYSDGACGTGVTSVEMAVGTFQSSFFFKGTKADSTTTISASQLGAVPPLTGSLALNVLSAAPAQLQFANVPSQVVKTVCSGPVSIAVFDAHGNTTASSSAIAISLQATNGGKFYGDDACASMLSSTSIAAAQNSVGSLYFKGTVIGTMNLVGLGPNSISAATSSVQVLAPPATKLVLGGTSPVNAGDCVPIPVTSVDSTTNQPSIFDPVAVTLGSSSHNPSVFFSNSSCTTAASLLTLDSSPKGTIYFKDTIAEEVQVLATALSGPAEGNQTIVVKPGAPAQLVFDTAGTSTLIVNSCTGPYKIISQDGLGNLSPLSANTSVGFSTTGAQVKAYSDNLCTNANVQIGANESNTLIYLSSAQLGASTLTATVGGLSPGVRSWNVINPSVIVSSIIPNQGPPTGSSSVTISGSNFVSGVTVSVGGQPCTGVLFDNSGRIRCTTPAGTIGFATVIITNPSALSSTIVNGFQYVDSAVVATVTPNSGPIAGGTVISLTGSSFQLGSTVSIGGQPCLSVVIASGTNITCTTSPGNAGTVAVSVTSPNGQTGSLASGFRYFGSPAITAVNPTTGVETGGTTIVLNGSSLEPGGAVTVGGVNCTNLIVSPTIATCRTGVHLPGVVDIQFTNPDGLTATLANSFTYLGLPIITQILPNSGPTTGGTAINITGQNFDSQSIVQIDGSGCGNIRNLSATFLTCDTPAAADVGAVDVVITNRTGQIFTLAGGFTYTYPPPQVVAVVPTSGTAVGGNSVEIDGFNFRAGVSVLIGGTPCGNVNFVSANKITCTAGANSPGPADVVVANIPSGTTTVAGGYSYISAPMLTSVTPASGSTAGGTSVTIVGTQFLAGPTVLFDLAACINVVAVSATQITCTTPVHSAGNVTVTVTNTDLGTVSKPNAFVYAAPPSLSSIAPTSAPSNGGITLTLTGSNFTNGLSITVGGQTCTSPTMVNANQATCAMPAVSPGNAAVVLTNADGQTAILAGGLTVNFPPSIASFSPTHVPEQGGAILTITGAHFVTGVTVTVDENNCTPVTMISATQIQCPTPAVTGPTVDMVVKNPDGQQATASGAITVDLPPAFANANALTPTHGPASGGTALTLTGSRFSVGAAVKLGNLACTGVSVVSPTQITCTTPPNMPSGPTDVIVKNADGQIATLSGGFTVDAPPSVTSVSPNHGPSGGGTTLTFAGNGFVNGTRIFFGAVECPGVVYESSTQVTCVLPALTAGLFAVKATNPDGQFTTLTGGFTADPPPILISTTPNNGPSSASIIITLAGSNFTTGVSVMIGGQTCTNPARSDNGTSLTCQTPLLPAGPADVV
ncbi:MAG: IPT/TIG domain-containing protein, partial [Deltaproteobacteria bacterium]|nr:IPT/TIG domain-containing protein [Deltaproteobacteria bacterium]